MTTITAMQVAENGRILAGAVAWGLPILVALGSFVICADQLKSIRMLGETFKGLGVKLPLPTKLLVANCLCLFPLFNGGATNFLIVKEFVMRSVQQRLITSVVVLVVGMVSLGLLHFILYLPAFPLTGKLAN